MLAAWLALSIAQVPQTSTAAISVSTSGVELFGIHIHGFVSQGAFKSTSNNYLGDSDRGSFAFSEAGLNVTKSITDDLTAGLQFFARFLGYQGGFSAKFDWFYLDYRFADWFGIRAGRVKLPFGFYNEFSDIDSARVPVLLPQGVYPIRNRDYLLAQTGVDLYGTVPIGPAGDLAYRLYGGTILFDDFGNERSNSPFEIRSLNTRYIFGGRLIWETPLVGLRFGGSVQALRIDFDLSLADTPIRASIPAVLWITSAEYINGDFTIAAEYGRWIVDLKSSQPDFVPESRTEREQFYVMTDYRVLDWFQPGIYYSAFFPNVKMRSGRANSQHDFAVTLRFDLNSFWLIKVEGHWLSGTAVLSSADNDDRPLNTLDRHWGLFLVKTTLSF